MNYTVVPWFTTRWRQMPTGDVKSIFFCFWFNSVIVLSYIVFYRSHTFKFNGLPCFLLLNNHACLRKLGMKFNVIGWLMSALVVHSPEPSSWGFTLSVVIIITVLLAILIVMLHILNQGKNKQANVQFKLPKSCINMWHHVTCKELMTDRVVCLFFSTGRRNSHQVWWRLWWRWIDFCLFGTSLIFNGI